MHIRHEGNPASAGSVRVTYVQRGKLHCIRAKAVVMGTGGWVTRNVVGDLPPAHAAAYGQFRYGPVLVANVAVRHWRYFDKLGFTVEPRDPASFRPYQVQEIATWVKILSIDPMLKRVSVVLGTRPSRSARP